MKKYWKRWAPVSRSTAGTPAGRAAACDGLEAWDERPDIRRAIAAATAIVDAGGTHDRTRDAADFLVAQTFREPDAARHMLRGARALVAHVPDYERWTRVLAQMDARRFYGPAGESSAPDLDRFAVEGIAP